MLIKIIDLVYNIVQETLIAIDKIETSRWRMFWIKVRIFTAIDKYSFEATEI